MSSTITVPRVDLHIGNSARVASVMVALILGLGLVMVTGTPAEAVKGAKFCSAGTTAVTQTKGKGTHKHVQENWNTGAITPREWTTSSTATRSLSPGYRNSIWSATVIGTQEQAFAFCSS